MVINPIVYDEKGKGNDVFSCNLESRVIHLVGEVTDEMAASVVAQLLHLASMGDEDIVSISTVPAVPSAQVWQSMTRCSISRLTWQRFVSDARQVWAQ